MNTKFPRYKVVCENGVANGTKLIDLETGQAVANITRLVLIAEPGNVWRAEVSIVGVAVDVGLTADGLKFTDAPSGSEPL